ncbi:TRAP transporter substrate-binding protein [Cellulosilyticum sp. I15G10I2]|uniref:TRAP transporter substrate-binding protein n=1 Tax=Cellulosilyticum sp. I15G10I2 TaxID=1892843 RepID=UPI00085CB63F|nr:TRAP transporter substrate-binding protein [Cellulosilyticum sp. I15G10I2]
MKSNFRKLIQIIAMMMIGIMTLTACATSEKPSNKNATTTVEKEAPAEAPKEVVEAPAFEFEKVTLRFGSTSAEGSIIVETMNDFSKRVAEKTSGNVTVEVFPASQLGGVKEMTQSLQVGALDMSMTQPASLVDMGIKEMSVIVLPYIFRDFEHRWNVLESEIGDSLLEKVDGGNVKLKGFGYFKDGARNFFTAKNKPIRKLEDIAGMKLRVQPYEMDSDMTVALGASPTPTAFAELYSAIQSGVVDGAEQPTAGYYNGKFYEVTKYFTLDEHTYNTLVVLFSELSWNKLQPEVQEVLAESWTEATETTKSKIIETEEEMLTKLEAEGVEVIRLTDRDKWVEAMKPVYDKHGVGFEELIAKIQEMK